MLVRKLTEVLKKEKVTSEDLKEVNDTVENIRKEGKALLNLNRQIAAETEKKPLPKEELENYRNKGGKYL